MTYLSRRHFIRTCAVASVAGTAVRGTSRGECTDLQKLEAHQRAVLSDIRRKAVDLREPIGLGVLHVCSGAVDQRQKYMPLVRFHLEEQRPYAQHEYWASPHMVGRFLDVLAVSAPIVDFPIDRKVVDALRQLLFDSLDNPSGFAFDAKPAPNRVRVASMHNCREVLLALKGLYLWQGCGQSLEMARRFVRTIAKAVSDSGGFPASTWSETGWVIEPREVDSPNLTSGRLIGALMKYYRVAHDPVAIEVAIRIAEHNMALAFTSDGKLTEAAGTHLHSTAGTVTGLIDLGRLINESAYIEYGKRLYDVGLRPWRTSYGWAKETRDATRGRGEANTTGDLIESALLLGHSGYREYFGDAERFIRNALLASQVINVDWISIGDDRPDTDDVIYRHVRQRARGGFAFTTPNCYHSYNTDLVGGSVQSLCEAWEAIVTVDPMGCHVNMLFSYASEDVTIRSFLPDAGRLEFVMHRPVPLLVRLPSWLNRKTLVVTVNGEPRTPMFVRCEMFLGDVKPNDIIVVTFCQPSERQSERVIGYDEEFQVEWLGDTVQSIIPQVGACRLY